MRYGCISHGCDSAIGTRLQAEQLRNFGKRSDTNSEEVEELCWTLISHSYQPIRFENQKELLYKNL